jgi:hypothetical protein
MPVITVEHGADLAFHMEGGKGALPNLVKFQIRLDPLAR